MKTKLFSILDNIHCYLYKKIYKITYLYITHKKTRNLKRLTLVEKRKISKYWKKEFGKSIPLNEFKWYKNKFNILEEKIIPDSIWHSEIEPYFCNINFEKSFCDKNYLDTIIENKNSPNTIIRCINYQLLNNSYESIDINECISNLNNNLEVILKPSIESGGGRGILFLEKKDFNEQKIIDLINKYEGNFIIQQVIKQNKFLAKFNNKSLNTFRILSFLYKDNVHILSSFLRIGGENSRLDNVSSGGFFVPISIDGKLFNYAYVENAKTNDLELSDAINKKIKLDKLNVPNWNNVVDVIKKYHYKLPHFKLINWDVSIDEKDNPIIVEYNLLDSSVSFHQISVGPIFGELTTEILNEIRDKRKK